MNSGKDKTPNSLINESSPYLLQHAYNPVNWLPFSDAAFEKAKKENKPVVIIDSAIMDTNLMIDNDKVVQIIDTILN